MFLIRARVEEPIQQKRAVTGNSDAPSYSAFGLAMQLGYLIVIPLVALAVGGRMLDKKFDSSPLFLLAGVLLSVFISSYLVYSKTKEVMKEIDAVATQKKSSDEPHSKAE
jgi:F0F1-type ATP synthase assembly protein I